MSFTPYLPSAHCKRGTLLRMMPHYLIPLGRVRNQAKLTRLAEDMRRRGWVGRPLLAHRDGRRYQAWTGSHRAAAANLAEVAIPVYCMNPDGPDTSIPNPRSVIRDTQRMKLLRPLGDAYATELMQAEIDG